MPTTISPTAENILAFGNITTQNLVLAGIATPGSAVELNCEGVSVARIQVTGTYTGALTPQGTVDGVTWVSITIPNVLISAVGVSSNTIASAATGIYMMQVAGFTAVRITGLAAVTGTAVVTINACRQDTPQPTQIVSGVVGDNTSNFGNPVLVSGVVRTTAVAAIPDARVAYLPLTSGRQVIQKPYGPGETDWQFAVATGGITNTTTAVTIKAAAGANIRNYCTGMTLMAQALGAATEVAIRDGAGGTVLWRSFIPAGGLPTTSIVFPTPLRGTANTLMEFLTLTASVTGAVFISAQGYAGA